MAEIVSLAEGVAAVVGDGDTVAIEGFTHLIPFAAGHEVIRQGRRELTLARMTPDVIYDQLIGAGCARRLVFSWGGNPGVGSLHRFRDAVQNQWPVPLEVEEHSHAGMANRYVAGASGLPFAVLRGYVGTDLPAQTESIKPITCPFTGEVAHRRPGVAPRCRGGARPAGRPGWQRAALGYHRGAQGGRAGLASSAGHRRGDRGHPRPTTRCDGAAHLGGRLRRRSTRRAHPSYAHGYDERDNAWYQAWDEISRDRDRFQRWLETDVLATPDVRRPQ